MSTEPQTTEQQTWMLTGPIYGDGPACPYAAEEHWFVFVPVEHTRADIEAAMQDPANVLNVSAYPGVVKAAKEAQERIGCGCPGEDELCSNCVAADDRLSAALALVHPEGDKT